MSSTNISPLVTTLVIAQKQSSFGFALIYLIFGITGCFLNVLLFSRRQFRTESCCIYFLAASVAMFIVLCISVGTALYSAYYGDLPMSHNHVYCKMFNYCSQSSLMTSRWTLAAASVDRYILSSTSARLRRFASVHIARRIVIIIVLIWILFPIPLLVIYDIKAGNCIIIYGYAASLYTAIFSLVNGCGIPGSIMIICTFLIRRNLANKRERRHFNTNQQQRTNHQEHLQQKRDQQALIMLFVQIFVFIICTIPWMIYMVYNTISLSVPNKPANRLVIEQFVYYLTGAVTFLFPTASFYLYTLASSMFRKELLILLSSVLCCKCFINNRRIQPIVDNTRRTTSNIQ